MTDHAYLYGTHVLTDSELTRIKAEAQREVLLWLHEQGVNAEQLDMALERFVEPHGLTLEWRAIPIAPGGAS